MLNQKYDHFPLLPQNSTHTIPHNYPQQGSSDAALANTLQVQPESQCSIILKLNLLTWSKKTMKQSLCPQRSSTS